MNWVLFVYVLRVNDKFYIVTNPAFSFDCRLWPIVEVWNQGKCVWTCSLAGQTPNVL